MLRMLEMAHREHGRLPWARLIEPAKELAEQGLAMPERLHALVACTAKDHLLGEAVALRLVAGGSQDAPYPKPWVPEQGKLAPVHLDFVVDKPGQIPVAGEQLS